MEPTFFRWPPVRLAVLVVAVLLACMASALSAQGVTRFRGGVMADSMSAEVLIPIVIRGEVADGDEVEFDLPWDLQVEEVSVRAGAVTNPADGTTAVDVLDDGVSILTAPLELVAAGATVRRPDMTVRVQRRSILRIAFTLTGANPAIADPTILISGRRRLPPP